MTVDAGDLAEQRAGLRMLRCTLGAHLAAYRRRAGISQPELAQALGRTRSTISKVEHGTRGMPDHSWKIADELCRAEGVMIALHDRLAQAEQDYRGRCRAQRRAAQQAAAQAQLEALHASLIPVPSSPGVFPAIGGHAWPDTTLMSGQLAEEFMAVVAKMIRSLPRRQAMQLAGWMLATIGLSGLDPEQCTRVAHAVITPRRVDAHVINILAATLAQCKRLEDTLGPGEVIDIVMAQQGIVHRLLHDGCPERFHKPLRLLDSTMATTIGSYLIDLGHPDTARSYFSYARRAAHKAGNAACAAYAAQAGSFAARLCGDTPAALDTAAAARSLAARTNDNRLKALAEQMAAGAYALDSQYDACMAAFGRAHDFLANTATAASDSPVYWVHHSSIDKHLSKALILLDRPTQAIEAAGKALEHYDPTYIGGYAMSQVRLGHALVLDKEITEATRILIDATPHAHLYPRLTAELHTVRSLMQPWAHTHAVKELDNQLQTHGLLPGRKG